MGREDILGDGDEVKRGHQAAARMLPAQEHFGHRICRCQQAATCLTCLMAFGGEWLEVADNYQ
ncbi:MAG: hypothetical protein ACYCWC_13045 [Rhodocyclaceae bacterium]